MDPFALAAKTLFRAAGSVAATYKAAGAAARPVRAIVATPDADFSFRAANLVQSTYAVSLERAEVAKPRNRDRITVPGASYPLIDGDHADDTTDTLEISSEPKLDAEGTSWTFGAEPV